MQFIVLAASAAVVLRLVLTGEYLYYVKPGMLPALIASIAVLAAMAIYTLVDAWRSSAPDADAGCAHDHAHGDGHAHGEPRAALLLVVPLMAVLLIAPAPLGAFTAARSTAPPAEPKAAPGGLQPLPPGDPVDVALSDFTWRAAEDGGSTLRDREVRMVGFVTPNPAGSWWLTRIAVACCAADAYPIRVQVADGPDLPADTWVSVTGRWRPGTGTGDGEEGFIPVLELTGYEQVPEPADPYQR